MLLASSITFCSAFSVLVFLFGLRLMEERRGARFFPRTRMVLDTFALWVKKYLVALEEWFQNLPPKTALLARLLLAFVVRQFARLAQRTAEAAHSIADIVSYKHRFERKETRSEFLKKVSEHKNGTSA